MFPITLYSLTSLTGLLSEARRGKGMFVFGGSQRRGGGASGGASTDDNLCTRQHKKIKTIQTL